MTRSEAELIDFIGQFHDDPLGFVMAAYEWDTDPQLQVCELQAPWNMIYDSKYGPDAWACELLDRVGAQVREHNFDGKNAVPAIREAIASGHGIGKSCAVSWLVDWIMSTRPKCHGTVTANTAPQLASKTWAEIAKWTKKCITGHWFEITTGKGAMRMYQRECPEDWFCNALTCDEHNSESFAGQHAVSSTSFYLFDEASKIPDVIWEVANGGLKTGEAMIFAFGNPTRNTGAFKDCFDDPRWHTQQIDSRDVQITNKVEIAADIAKYGIDSDVVKVRIRGVFPSASCYQFISTADVDAATHVHLRKEQYSFAPKILTLDPAWTGDDDAVFGLRQGLRYETIHSIARNDNDVTMASLLAQFEDEHQADAVFVDAGFGTGIVSVGRSLGRNWQLVWFGGASPDPGYLNMRAWIWGQMKQWLKDGGAIDEKDRQLYRDLIGMELIGRTDGKIQLMGKADMAQSPNRADTLALSFAFPVTAKKLRHIDTRTRAAKDYDPHSLMD